MSPLAIGVLILFLVVLGFGLFYYYNNESITQRGPGGIAIPNNTVMYREENKDLYFGSCTSDDSGNCEPNNTKLESYNSSFNYSIFFEQPVITNYYKNYYKYALMDGDQVVISEGYQGSDNQPLTVNDVLCTHHIALVVTCPIPENTTFRLVNVTLVNNTATYNTLVDAIVNVVITDTNGNTLYSNSCDFSQHKEIPKYCQWQLESSIASEIVNSRISLSIKNTDGSPVKNAYQAIGISGRALFPTCKLINGQCIPV